MKFKKENMDGLPTLNKILQAKKHQINLKP